MPIKYAEITIARNLEQENWFSYFKNLIGEENYTDKDTIVILFDDETIIDTKSVLVDKQFKFGNKIYQGVYPIYFKKQDLLFYYKEPSIKNGFYSLNFSDIFKDEPRYKTLKKVPSVFNAIYCSIIERNELFALVKNGHNHRYLLAYDNDSFEKADIIYLIHHLFLRFEKK